MSAPRIISYSLFFHVTFITREDGLRLHPDGPTIPMSVVKDANRLECRITVAPPRSVIFRGEPGQAKSLWFLWPPETELELPGDLLRSIIINSI